MLKVNGIDVYYGKVQALFDVSIEVGDNEIVSIIGANGAGKTTLMTVSYTHLTLPTNREV